MTAKSPPDTLSPEGRRLWLELNRIFAFERENLLLLKVALENLDLMNQARRELLEQGLSIPAGSGGRKGDGAQRHGGC